MGRKEDSLQREVCFPSITILMLNLRSGMIVLVKSKLRTLSEPPSRKGLCPDIAELVHLPVEGAGLTCCPRSLTPHAFRLCRPSWSRSVMSDAWSQRGL